MAYLFKDYLFTFLFFTFSFFISDALVLKSISRAETKPTASSLQVIDQATTDTSMSINAVALTDKKCLIILHGLARTKFSMSAVENYFNDQDFTVFNKAYPSTKKKIEDLSNVVGEGVSDCTSAGANQIFFVTHSMGGILVRHYFQSKTSNPHIKAVVMLAPPNQGSEIVDAFKNQSWYKWYNGPAGLQLGTSSDSLPNQLKPIQIPIGIITGNVSSDPWFSYLFDGPNDGKVSVESAKLKEMKAMLIVPQGHTFIMSNELVHQQIKYFFENQTFK
jgi:hypothetical protein